MAAMPAIRVPVIPEVAGLASIKCAFHADPAIRDGLPLDDVPDAVTFAGHMQEFTVTGPQGTQNVMAPVSLPVCYACRKDMLGVTSKAGLLTA